MTTLQDLPEQIEALRPLDEHNESLARHVHPPDWTNPEPSGRYNLVVIGAGTAGLVAAAGAAGLGAKVALIERSMMGGDCLNVGCVPSKALISAARAFHHVKHSHRFGVRIEGEVSLDFPAVMQRMRRLRARIAPNDSAERFRDLGIDVFLGEARFTGAHTVSVAGKTLEFAKACIATGTRALVPPIDGIEQVEFLTNETIFSLTEQPRSMAIIGAGPIGCEMAQTFARFGTEVHLIEAMDQILTREDADAAGIIATALEDDGVHIHCCGKAARVQPREGGGVVVSVDQEKMGRKWEVEVEKLLIAVGRRPNVEGLDLQAAGVEYDKQGVRVNDALQTTNPDVFAAGDICFPYKFTHVADAMARIVIQNALFDFKINRKKKASALTIPWCTYTEPEIAHAGLSEDDARTKGVDIETIRIDLDDVDRAILESEDVGFLKVHVQKGSDRIVGATLVAARAGDMISELTTAMQAKLGLGGLANVIHPYPTQAEVIRKAGDAYNRTRLTPTVKAIFNRILAWKR